MPKEYVEAFFKGRPNTTVLFVDDHKNLRMVGLHLLQELGFTNILLAGDGEEALKLYQEFGHEIVLVVSDFQMPLMNGEELFYKLKQINGSLRMVLCSGSDPGDCLHSLKRSGLRSFLPKPFMLDDFGLAVANALS